MTVLCLLEVRKIWGRPKKGWIQLWPFEIGFFLISVGQEVGLGFLGWKGK